MPWLLYRYILLDLLRIIGLTTAILVTVIAFGATIKPLTRHGLDAVQTAKYLGLAVVPMLQFALPFAAGFGATLSLYRMTTDNEIQAMAASGISYRRILLPVVALGLALTLLMVVLTQSVIPRFWGMILQTVTADLTKMFQVAIERGEAFQLGQGGMQVYADRLVVQDSPLGPDGPQKRLFLLHVAAADMDREGRIITDVTASRGVVDIYRRGGQTYLKMVLEDAVALNTSTGNLVQSDRIAPPRALTVPSALTENPKGMTQAQLLALRKNPNDYGAVISAKEALADAMLETQVRQTIDARLRDEGRLELVSIGEGLGVRDQGSERVAGSLSPDPRSLSLGGSRHFVINAERLNQSGRFSAGRDRPIEIVQFDDGVPTFRFVADSAELAPSASGSLGAHSFDLIIGGHEITNLQQAGGPGIANRRPRLVVPDLMVAGVEGRELAELPAAKLIERSGGRPRHLVAKLAYEVERLQHEITGRLAQRYALSATAFLLLLLGATMAMWLRGSLPLTTYAWAFIPAVVDLIVISAGEQLIRDGREWGHALMWSGNGLLLLIFFVAYFRLSRN